MPFPGSSPAKCCIIVFGKYPLATVKHVPVAHIYDISGFRFIKSNIRTMFDTFPQVFFLLLRPPQLLPKPIQNQHGTSAWSFVRIHKWGFMFVSCWFQGSTARLVLLKQSKLRFYLRSNESRAEGLSEMIELPTNPLRGD
jgi:hypothetical protein